MVKGRLASASHAFLPLLLLAMAFFRQPGERHQGFARVSGTRFVMDKNRPFYLNGFNAYWMMQLASNPNDRAKVQDTLQQASRHGMNVARTWAFSDGGHTPLQITPGVYNENMFKGLDFVVSEARRNRVHLIFSLVNNYENYGGRKQYVQWAREHAGQYLNCDDDFYTNPVTKAY